MAKCYKCEKEATTSLRRDPKLAPLQACEGCALFYQENEHFELLFLPPVPVPRDYL